MNLNRRLTEILRFLFLHREPISSNDLAHQFSISDRTLRSDIKSINESIVERGAKILHIRNHGYQLEVHNIDSFDRYIHLQNEQGINTQELETADKRIKHLVVELLYAKHHLSLDSLANSVFVSHSTILNYMKTIKSLVAEYDLSLKNKINVGYIVDGTENNKRSCILDMVSSDITNSPVLFSQEQSTIFSNIDLNEIRRIILTNGSINGIRFSDFNLKNLILHIALMISRIENDAGIEHFDLPDFDNEMKQTIDKLLEEIELTFKINIPSGERSYIYTHFFSNSPAFISEVNNETIQSLITSILENLYGRFDYDLRSDSLLITDLDAHLRSILTLKYFNLQKKNPLLHTIKSNYPFEFEITLITLKETLKGKFEMFSEDEVAYIALHIGAAIERFSTTNRELKRVMLVCGSGHATIRMIEAQLNSYFKNRIIITQRLSYNEFTRVPLVDIDIIITTVPIHDMIDVPIIYIELPIQVGVIEKIETQLFDSQDSFDLMKYFDEKLFFPQHKAKTKEMIIEALVDNLLEQKLVDHTFLQSVLQRENLASTLMDEIIAIPHPLSASARHTKIAVAILESPVIWNSGQTAQIVLLLAIAETDRNHLENLYGAFVNITNNPKAQSQILKAQTLQDFLAILNNTKQL